MIEVLNLNYCYRIYPDASQEKELLEWLEICRGVYNYALLQRKEWINSRKCQVNACSLHSEYIIPASQPFPDYYKQKKAFTLDAGFGGFLEVLNHVAWKRDVYFEKVDANFTSQICPNCGVVTGKKELSQRVHECSNCGFLTDRDVAAAMVVEQRGLAALGLGVKLPVEEDVIGDIPKKVSRASRRNRKAS